MSYDEIEFYYKGTYLAKTCLPESSTTELRKVLAKHLGIKNYDQFLIISADGTVRYDSKETKIKKGNRIYKVK